MSEILIVDDEKNIRRSVEMILKGEGYSTHTAEDGKEALVLLKDRPIRLVFLDLLMPGMSGLEVLKEIRQTEREITVVMMSGHGTIENAVEAVKAGAYDFIEKPLTKDKLLIVAQNAMERVVLKTENKILKNALPKGVMIGDSGSLSQVKALISKVAPTSTRVLIMGESGTGKELVARAMHEGSPRKDKPFIKVNCAAIPEELIESELFGAVKGAYTGAVADRDGKFMQAHTGTIFLDEIGDMSLKVQAKVLRALQEGEFEKVGGTKTLKVDVRVIAATNKDLKAESEKGNFREDLYFRLNVVPILMPPLRERKSDIPLLVDFFIQQCAMEGSLRPKQFTEPALQLMTQYGWRGNIRELRNVVERLLILTPGEMIEPEDLPIHIYQSGTIIQKPDIGSYDGKSLKDFKEAMEKEFIIQVLAKHNWNVTRAAGELELERTNLHKKIKQFGIDSGKLAD